jgi:CRISPR-associated exonuclease Cas4
MVSTYVGEKTDYYLNASDLTQYYYCKRKVYFLKVAGVQAPIRRKMEVGKEEHSYESKRMLERNDLFGIPREDVREVAKRKFLASEKLRLKGIVDVLLTLKDGCYVPVEIKYTDDPEANLSRKKQLLAYMLLCEEALGGRCDFGVLYFSVQNTSVKLTASEGDKQAVKADLKAIWEMFRTESLPRKAPAWKCAYCEVKRYCWT